jgi:hypothetical protein
MVSRSTARRPDGKTREHNPLNLMTDPRDGIFVLFQRDFSALKRHLGDERIRTLCTRTGKCDRHDLKGLNLVANIFGHGNRKDSGAIIQNVVLAAN